MHLPIQPGLIDALESYLAYRLAHGIGAELDVARYRGLLPHQRAARFAGKVLAATGDMDTVAILLGHSSIDCSQRYVDVDQAFLKKYLPMRYELQKVASVATMQPIQRSIPYGCRNETF